MHYEEFFEAVKSIDEYYKQRRADKGKKKRYINRYKCGKYNDFYYPALRERGADYWLHLERMNESELAEEIIVCFLNTQLWNCHLDDPNSPKGAKMVRNLKAVVDQLPDHYAALQGRSLENIDFTDRVVLGDKLVPILWVIADIYAKFRGIKPRFGPVPTSKLMHMALPNLFMMWDNAICKSYSIPSDIIGQRSYIGFLVLMQENIRHITRTHPDAPLLSGSSIQNSLNHQLEHDGYPMTRYLDFLSYAIANGKVDKPVSRCSSCAGRANERLQELHSNPLSAPVMEVLRVNNYRWAR